MMKLVTIVARLKKHYGKPEVPPVHGPFELVMWENACYLLPDERRWEVFDGLRRRVGMNAAAIDKAREELLLELAKRGGMRPETRVFRWREIARLVLSQFGGDLDSILKLPYAEAKRALKLFPTIGDPGAEKILLLCGMAHGLPLESNGLRVLVRLGRGRLQKSYGAMYKSVEDDIAPELPEDAKWLTDAHLLLKEHGKTLCKDKTPLCSECPLAKGCDYASKQLASFMGEV
jgi:endonuclease-3